MDCAIRLEVTMSLRKEGYLLRLFIGEDEKHEGKPLYEWIVRQADKNDLAGVTVFRGIMGYGASSRSIKTQKIEVLAEGMPVVVEIVDEKEKLEQFMEFIDDKINAGLATLEKAEIRIYRGKKA
jgi:PII-like signaling protein